MEQWVASVKKYGIATGLVLLIPFILPYVEKYFDSRAATSTQVFVYKIKEMYKRTNIEIDLNLVKEVMEKYRLKTIKEAVNFSLERTIESKKRKNLLQLKGKVKWEGNLDEIRPSQKISFAKTG